VQELEDIDEINVGETARTAQTVAGSEAAIELEAIDVA